MYGMLSLPNYSRHPSGPSYYSYDEVREPFPGHLSWNPNQSGSADPIIISLTPKGARFISGSDKISIFSNHGAMELCHQNRIHSRSCHQTVSYLRGSDSCGLFKCVCFAHIWIGNRMDSRLYLELNYIYGLRFADRL